MTEEGQAGASVVIETTEAPEGTQKETTGMVNPDGTFVDGWTQKLKDETLRDDATLKTLKSLDALAGNHVLQRKKIGANTMIVPSETSTNAEWEAYHKAGGRPETAGDYNLSIPDDAPEGMYTKEGLAEWQDLFHKLGLSKKQAEILFETDKAKALSVLKTRQQEKELAREEAKSQLYQKWGNAYEQRIHFGDVAVNEGAGGNQEFIQRLISKYGDDPDFIELTSNLGAKFTERGSIAAANIPTPGDIQRQIDEIMHSDAYENGSHLGHKQAVQAAAKLFRDRAASTKTG